MDYFRKSYFFPDKLELLTWKKKTPSYSQLQCKCFLPLSILCYKMVCFVFVFVFNIVRHLRLAGWSSDTWAIKYWAKANLMVRLLFYYLVVNIIVYYSYAARRILTYTIKIFKVTSARGIYTSRLFPAVPFSFSMKAHICKISEFRELLV